MPCGPGVRDSAPGPRVTRIGGLIGTPLVKAAHRRRPKSHGGSCNYRSGFLGILVVKDQFCDRRHFLKKLLRMMHIDNTKYMI
jgi:hypothetical protein